MWEHCGVAVCAVRLVSEGRVFEANLVRMPRDKVLSVIVSLKRRLILTNQNRALRTCVWFFWFAFKRKFYATGPIPGGPKNPGTVDFLGLCSDQQLSFSPCWIEHLSLIIITPSSSNSVENFLFYEYFLMDCHFRDLPLIFHWWVAPQKTEQSIFLELCSDEQLFFFTLLDRTSFPHYNDTKIIKFGWKLFILWVISYRLSFLGFAINMSSCLETLEIGQITKMTVHNKCLIK